MAHKHKPPKGQKKKRTGLHYTKSGKPKKRK